MNLLLMAVWAARALCAGGDPRLPGDARATALLNAAYRGGQDEVRALLAAGADADTRDPAGVTAFSLAVAGGHADVAALLLAHGADVNEPFTPCARAGHSGVTPLMSAASRGDTLMVELLLAHGADASAEVGELAEYNAGVTALYLAEVKGRGDAAGALRSGCAAWRSLWKFFVLGLWGGAWLILKPRGGTPPGESDDRGRRDG
jgi:ankyrin repeat protein